ncbi:MAG TPA: RloB family protein [Chitinispirillaceae bacterium]|nr:RloB family protein [Chitinispirillaceae bacterium]
MRNKRTVSSRPSFAVVVDGECEVWYLQMIKRHERSININIEPKLPQKKSLQDQYDIVCKIAEDYSKVFWIVDFDVILKETRVSKKGRTTPLQNFSGYCKNKKENIIIIVNNPCLEFWFLLHFEFTSKYFNSYEEIERYIKRKYLPDYSKNQEYYTKQDRDIYLRLKPYLGAAIRNAEKLEKFDPSEPHRGLSEMHLFFRTEDLSNVFAHLS